MSDNTAAQGEHLPDCFLGQPCRSNGGKEHVMQGTVAGFPVTICGLCMYDCICAALRACEARVLNEYRQQHDGISERYFQQIRNDALDAATEAVAALPFDFPLDDDHRGRIHKAAALAAIAALKSPE